MRGTRLAVGLVVPLAVVLLLGLFAWPQARPRPRDLPIAVAGPPEFSAEIERRVAGAGQGGAFDLRRYPRRAEAQAAIENREVYGAIVGSARGAVVLTAPAASPAAAQVLSQSLASVLRPPLRTVEVVATPAHDPRGAALGASVLPLLLAGVLTGALIGSHTRPGFAQALSLAGASALAGLAAVLVAQGWLEIIRGGWLANAGVIGLMVLSIASCAAGLQGLIGRGGVVAVAMFMMLIGNPWSGASSAPELLPVPVGDVGQLLPPGAALSALRGTAFFDGAGATAPAIVLGLWAALGLAAVGAATVHARHVVSGRRHGGRDIGHAASARA